MSEAWTDKAEIVIIGGGAVGCSVAYHLAKFGKRDVLLLEKAGLTHGATWHAAGLVGQLRNKQNLTRMMQYSAKLYGELEAETGQATDWKAVGSLRLASSPDRWQELEKSATTAKSFGFELYLLDPKETLERFPIMDPSGIIGSAFIPSDGYVDPSSLTQSLAKGARQQGVKIREGVCVTDLVVEQGRVRQVITDHGTVDCDLVVNAAGLWARQIGEMAGVGVPAVALEHQYLVTENLSDIPADLPTMRDPDKNFYLKPEVGGFAIGGWEGNTVSFGEEGIPFSFGRELFDGNMERFEQIILPTAERLPIVNEIGIRTLINGPIPASPDGEPILGPSPNVANFYLACGFTAGIAGCGGAGQALAEWIVEGRPSRDLWAFDVRRFGPHHMGRDFLHARAIETYGRYYKIHWPGEEAESGRGLRRSPLYDRLKESGAVYGSKFGWERPNWFAPPGAVAVDQPSFERPNWFEPVAAEHQAARTAVGIVDQSSFSKYDLTGPGALDALQRLCVSNMDKKVGSVIYTQMCNDRGGIEADLTICRLAPDHFYIVTGSGFGVHDSHWIESHLPSDGSVSLKEVTEAFGVVNVFGPRSREVLEGLCQSGLGNEDFPFATCRRVFLAGAPVLALRIGYVGELGWELHMPPSYLAGVYDAIWQAGQDAGITNVGYRAIDSLRMEKGYLYWSGDITPDYTPLEAGLDNRVAFGKGDFMGRTALLAQREQGITRRLCLFVLEQSALLFGGEAILRNGKVLGVTTSANFGHFIGKPVALGYLPAEQLAHRDFVIESFGNPVPASRLDQAPYDPKMQRLKG
ncbi:MAG: FAD-dependent oxidoreductase [Pseudomonadota bacterium]